ncbi:MAG: GNAT family N-acetyltransferase [Actinomycetota bacterium]|nr:GNAT family N-acetyltransferase [Actinomycetota bacterium]
MAAVQIAHTAWLSPEELQAIRILLDEAFNGDVTEDDYEHALGGMHALIWEDRELIGHGSVIMRRLLHGSRALRTGYVEGVAVRADHRRHGHGAALMTALERVIRGGYEIGALGSSDEAADFYAAREWQQWMGTASVIAPGGIERTAQEEGCIYVLPVSAELTPDGDLACDWRGGDVW